MLGRFDKSYLKIAVKNSGVRRWKQISDNRALSDECGQITVFLSLLFLVLIGFCFCILQGVQNYNASALGEDAVISAGENIMANYDRELFKKYHIFFLDPRERRYLISDGKEYINQYFSAQSFFGVTCDSLEITEEKTAVDEDGLYLKHEIREWMKYREEQKVKESFKRFIKNVQKSDGGRKQYQKELNNAEIDSKDIEKVAESTEQSSGYEEKTLEEKTLEEKTENSEEEISLETQRERINWKEIRETLQLLMKTGVLFYVADKPEQLSKRTIFAENLPSKGRKVASEDKEKREIDKVGEVSFSGLKGIKSLFSVDFSIRDDSSLWTKENYIVPYIEECFSTYGEKVDKNNTIEKVLFYETEYLINGKASDLENLKDIANYILLLRFINNYAFTGKDARIKAQIDTMASALAGILGMPQTIKGIQILIRAAISYGESLLELHTLFSGGEIPVIKSKGNWNLELKTMVKQLKEKKHVKKGGQNVSYKDYLKLILFIKGNSKALFYRMMDIMQENVACKEAGFLMENCLFSYKWRGNLSFGAVTMNFERQSSY